MNNVPKIVNGLSISRRSGTCTGLIYCIEKNRQFHVKEKKALTRSSEIFVRLKTIATQNRIRKIKFNSRYLKRTIVDANGILLIKAREIVRLPMALSLNTILIIDSQN